MARLFVAVWPTPSIVERLCSLVGPDAAGVRQVRPENWHVTLRFLGEAAPADVTARLERTTWPGATAVYGPAVRRLGRGAVIVPVAGLELLARAAADATADIGEPSGTRSFNGHLTLARLRSAATSDLPGTPITAAAAVTEVVLVESVLSHDGATYHVIGRWPTAPSSGDARRS
ncbi:MAG: 2'-5' RNA ligase family protein [Ilumatobacteraceae bacterium]